VAVLVGDGVPIERAFAITEPIVGERLRAVLGGMRRLVREGHSVSEAMASYPAVMPDAVVGIIRAGERGSRLAEACEAAAEQLEAEVRLHSEVWSALAYPLLVLFVGVTSIVVMGGVVVPRFAEILAGMDSELPPTTRALLGVSAAVRRFGLPAIVASAVAVVVAARWTRRPSVRARLHAFLLAVPIVGPLRRGFSTARVCRTLGGLLNAGMPLLPALDVAADAAADLEVRRRIELAREAVGGGRGLTDALTEHHALTPIALQLSGVGESSGRLGPMLVRGADIVADRTHRALRALVGVLEPTLVIVLGALVAGVAAALLQAVYAVRP
jgi:type II secretory pathway component PulF